jgi:hypothetical protein
MPARSQAQSQAQSPVKSSITIQVVAPLAAMAATWAVRKALDSGYRRVRGHKAPSPHDPNVSFSSALLWATITAAAAAAVEVAVFRIVTRED